MKISFFLTLMLSALRALPYSASAQNNTIKTRQAIATITGFTGRGSSEVCITFFDSISNQKIKIYDDRKSYMEIGNKYSITYNPEKPKKNVVIAYSNPLFEANESTKKTIAVIQANDATNEVEYKYRVNNVVYDDFQFLPFTIFSQPGIKPGHIFEITYATSNPARSSINLSKSISAESAFSENGFYIGQNILLKDSADMIKTTCEIYKTKETIIKYKFKQYDKAHKDSIWVKDWQDIMVNVDSNKIGKGFYTMYYSPLNSKKTLILFDYTTVYRAPKVLSNYGFRNDPSNFADAYVLLVFQNSFSPNHLQNQTINISVPYTNPNGQFNHDGSKTIHASPLKIQTVISMGLDLNLKQVSGYATIGIDADNAYSVINSVRLGLGHDFNLKQISQSQSKLKLVFSPYIGYAYYNDNFSMGSINDDGNNTKVAGYSFYYDSPINVHAHIDRHYIQPGIGLWLLGTKHNKENGYNISRLSFKADIAYNYLIATDGYVTFNQTKKNKNDRESSHTTSLSDSSITSTYSGGLFNSHNIADNFMLNLTLAYRLL
jgi:hypothetical protein